MLDVLRQDLIGETLDAYKAKFSNTDEAAEGFRKILLTCSSFMRPIDTFVGHKTNIGRKGKKLSIAHALKELIDIVPTLYDTN